MDRHSQEGLQETTQESLEETIQWILECQGKYGSLKPIITPRYVPSCSREFLDELGKLAETYQVPVQSHLSEELDEWDTL